MNRPQIKLRDIGDKAMSYIIRVWEYMDYIENENKELKALLHTERNKNKEKF